VICTWTAHATISEAIAPESGQHREAVRQEFLLGLERLVQAVQLLTAGAAETRLVTRPMATSM
jgi:hypothetical protein